VQCTADCAQHAPQGHPAVGHIQLAQVIIEAECAYVEGHLEPVSAIALASVREPTTAKLWYSASNAAPT
jgi:hypothetical protein